MTAPAKIVGVGLRLPLGLLGLFNLILPAVFSAECSCLFSAVELKMTVREGVSCAAPAHTRVLPPLLSVPLYSPNVEVMGPTLHHILTVHEDLNPSVLLSLSEARYLS